MNLSARIWDGKGNGTLVSFEKVVWDRNRPLEFSAIGKIEIPNSGSDEGGNQLKPQVLSLVVCGYFGDDSSIGNVANNPDSVASPAA